MTRRRLFGLIGFLMIALASGFAVFYRAGQSTPVPMTDALTIVVGIEGPESVVVGDAVPVSVTAIGREPLVQAQLFAGETVVDSSQLSTGVGAVLTLHWNPQTHGFETLTVQVHDSSGRVGTSNQLFVEVVSALEDHFLVTEEEGSTLDDIATAAGVPVASLIELNPGVESDDILSPGSLIRISDPPQPEPPTRATIDDEGVLKLDRALDRGFLYVRSGGDVWRIPGDPADAVRVGPGGLGLRGLLPPLPDGDVDIEVWRRASDGVHLIDSIRLDSATVRVAATDLHALFTLPFTNSTASVKSITVDTKTTVQMEWKANVSHTGVLWFLATTKPGPASALDPTGVLQSGEATPTGRSHRFPIDMTKNATQHKLLGISAWMTLTGSPTQPSEPPSGRPWRPSKNTTAWAWVIPVDAAGLPVGPPSEPVQVVITPAPFDPSDAPPYDVRSVQLVLPPAPNFSLSKCARVVSQTPPFPTIGLGFYMTETGQVQRIGSGGTKITGTLPYPMDPNGGAIYPFTACPGETGNFQWGSVGCGTNPLCHISKGLLKLGQAAVAFGQFLLDLANGLASAINELKAMAIDAVASALCPSEVAAECKAMIQIGVDVMLTSLGVPPTLPEFDDLAKLAQGELIDIALDQLGVGGVCDAVATAGTGKTCGELATQLQNMDACALAPKGQEQSCRNLVQQAAAVCSLATQASQCELLTANAQDLLKEGYGEMLDASVEAVKMQVTKAALESLGFPANWHQSTAPHHCHWGGPGGHDIICPPWTADLSNPPDGCHYDNNWKDGWIKCEFPPGSIDVIPEPYGQFRPIELRFELARNDNPLPDDYQCGPVYGEVISLSPEGYSGKPYLPAGLAIPSGPGLFGLEVYALSMNLGEPNPHVVLKKPEDVPQGPTDPLILEAVSEYAEGAGWTALLAPGSLVGFRIFGDCIAETFSDNPFGVAGVIPHPQPRMTPGNP